MFIAILKRVARFVTDGNQTASLFVVPFAQATLGAFRAGRREVDALCH
jgi:hypothetical protein